MHFHIVSILLIVYNPHLINAQDSNYDDKFELFNDDDDDSDFIQEIDKILQNDTETLEINSLSELGPINKTITDTSEKLHDIVETDLNDIEKELKQYEEFKDNPFLKQHKQRAYTFWHCCFPTSTSNNHQIEEYMANYKSVDSQTLIIFKCLTKLNTSYKKYCQNDLKTLYTMRKNHQYYLSQKLKNNRSLIEKSLKQIENTNIDIDTKNIVQSYERVTRNQCDPALTMLWSPEDLLDCEKKIRLSFIERNVPIEIYLTFSEKISLPFLKLTLDLLEDLKEKWQNLEEIHELRTISNITPSIPDKTIDYDMFVFKNSLSSYSTDRHLLEHPLIQHYAIRAHTYAVCCGKYETEEYVQSYLSYYADNFRDRRLFNQLTEYCSKHQIPLNPEFKYDECNAVVDTLNMAIDQRHNFSRTYRKQNPHLFENFRYALQLEEKDIQVIRRERVYVNFFCPYYHVFELMFDFDKWIQCEQMIRFSLKSNINDYYPYSNSLSKLFTVVVLNTWRKLKDIVDNLNTNTISTTTPTTIRENHRPKIESRPQSDYIYGGAISMQTMIYPSLCVSFLNLMQTIIKL